MHDGGRPNVADGGDETGAIEHVTLERHECLTELRPQMPADESIRPGDEDTLHLSRRRDR